MLTYSTGLRAGAIIFGVAIAAADGRATVLQAYANGWTGDTVVLIIAAVAVAALAPTFILEAFRGGNRTAGVLLGCAFLLAATASVSLTMQRVGAQVDGANYAVETTNHPIRTNLERITEHRNRLAAIERDARVAAASVLKHETTMSRERVSGEGPAWREARGMRDAAADRVRILRESRAEIIAGISALEKRADALGPVRANSFSGPENAVIYSAALFALPASIGLFLFGFSARRDAKNDVDEVRANSRTDVENDANSAGDSPRELPRTDVVRDILAAAHRSGELPSWTDCRQRFVKADGTQYAAATITKYRNVAAAQWAMQHSTAAN